MCAYKVVVKDEVVRSQGKSLETMEKAGRPQVRLMMECVEQHEEVYLPRCKVTGGKHIVALRTCIIMPMLEVEKQNMEMFVISINVVDNPYVDYVENIIGLRAGMVATPPRE